MIVKEIDNLQELVYRADCIGIKVYKIVRDCNHCEFDESSDRFHCGFDNNGDTSAAGCKPICKYKVEERFIPITEYKEGDIINKAIAQAELDELNYLNACAIVYYKNGDCDYAVNLEAIKHITSQTAKEVIESIK